VAVLMAGAVEAEKIAVFVKQPPAEVSVTLSLLDEDGNGLAEITMTPRIAREVAQMIMKGLEPSWQS
jgi:hypothetical protein